MTEEEQLAYWMEIAEAYVRRNARMFPELAGVLRAELDALIGRGRLASIRKYCEDHLADDADMLAGDSPEIIQEPAIRQHLMKTYLPKRRAQIDALLAKGKITTDRQFALAMSFVDEAIQRRHSPELVEPLNAMLRAYEARAAALAAKRAAKAGKTPKAG